VGPANTLTIPVDFTIDNAPVRLTPCQDPSCSRFAPVRRQRPRHCRSGSLHSSSR
jgi:hypothetical protein